MLTATLNTMPKKVLFFLVFSFFLLANSYSKTAVTIYGDGDYPPYSYIESGEITGIYTHILKRIFEKMPEYDVKLQGLPWKRGLIKIMNGEIFALYPPYKRAERPYMEYEHAILDEQLVVYCRLSVLKNARPNWPYDYFGLNIGNNSGFAAGGNVFWQAVQNKKIFVQETPGTRSNLLKLIAGRTDCYMNDRLSIKWELKKLQKEGKYSSMSVKQGAVISAEQGFLGFIKDGKGFPFKDDFKKKFFPVLKQMQESGEIEQIISEYLEE